MSESTHIDDGTAAELEDDDEEPMNAKGGGLGQIAATAVVAALAAVGVNKLTDSNGDEKSTVAAIATLTANVTNLSEQVKKLSEQPYATRSDLDGLSNRLTGLEQRVTGIERQEQPRRPR